VTEGIGGRAHSRDKVRDEGREKKGEGREEREEGRVDRGEGEGEFMSSSRDSSGSSASTTIAASMRALKLKAGLARVAQEENVALEDFSRSISPP
jgi:hypothetical protein